MLGVQVAEVSTNIQNERTHGHLQNEDYSHMQYYYQVISINIQNCFQKLFSPIHKILLMYS